LTEASLDVPRRRRAFRVSPRVTWGAAALIVFAIVWELAFWAGLLNPRFVAPPSAAASAGWELVSSGELWPHAWTSVIEFFWGSVFGIVIGVLLGFAMAQWRTVDSALSPTVWAIYSVPRTAFVPLLLVWFGIGLASKSAFVFLGMVFPMIANTYLGVRETDPYAIRSAQSFGASRLETMRKVIFPSAFPYLIDGLRLGAGRGIVGVIIAELYVSTSGVGYLLRLAGLGFQTAQLIFLTVLVAAFGIVVSQFLIWLDHKIAGWRQAGTATS
jgi:ABC-type nitrate/sulfonate/bicarbonate transport system permease component